MATEVKTVRFNTIQYWKNKILEAGGSESEFTDADKKNLKRDELKELAIKKYKVSPTKEEKSTLFTKDGKPRVAKEKKSKKQETIPEDGPEGEFDDFEDNGPEIVNPDIAGMSPDDLEDLAGEKEPEPEVKKPAPKKRQVKVKVPAVGEVPVSSILRPRGIMIDGLMITGNLSGHTFELL